jgi:hypothetical protein
MKFLTVWVSVVIAGRQTYHLGGRVRKEDRRMLDGKRTSDTLR